MTNWKEYKLGDIADYINRGVTPSYSDEGVIVINQKCVRDGQVKYEQSRYTNSEKKKISEEKYLKSFDILINSTGQGTLGRVGQVKKIISPTTVDSHLTIVRVNKNHDPIFLGYVLKSKQSIIEDLAEGTTGQTELSRYKVAALPLVLPDLPTQSAIAEILSSLDDKIELNNKINQELENLAQTLFKQWFIDFEFPNENGEPYKSSGGEMVESEFGEIPKGWRVATIEEVSEKVGMGPFGANIKVETFVDDGIPIISGQHLKGTLVEDNDYNFITVSHAKKLKNSIVSSGDVIFTHAGNIGQVAYLHSSAKYEEYIISQRQFYLRPINEIASGLFLTLFFKSPIGQSRLLANTSSTGVPSISRPVTYLRSIKVVISTTEIMTRFTELVMSFYNDIACNYFENKTLSNLRDNLLPKLISGELEVSQTQTNS